MESNLHTDYKKVALSAFVLRLFHDDFSPITRTKLVYFRVKLVPMIGEISS